MRSRSKGKAGSQQGRHRVREQQRGSSHPLKKLLRHSRVGSGGTFPHLAVSQHLLGVTQVQHIRAEPSPGAGAAELGGALSPSQLLSPPHVPQWAQTAEAPTDPPETAALLLQDSGADRLEQMTKKGKKNDICCLDFTIRNELKGLDRKKVKFSRRTSNNGAKKSTMAFLWFKRYDLVSFATLAVSYSIITIIFKSNTSL